MHYHWFAIVGDAVRNAIRYEEEFWFARAAAMSRMLPRYDGCWLWFVIGEENIVAGYTYMRALYVTVG